MTETIIFIPNAGKADQQHWRATHNYFDDYAWHIIIESDVPKVCHDQVACAAPAPL
jgi:hypothetical protein